MINAGRLLSRPDFVRLAELGQPTKGVQKLEELATGIAHSSESEQRPGKVCAPLALIKSLIARP